MTQAGYGRGFVSSLWLVLALGLWLAPGCQSEISSDQPGGGGGGKAGSGGGAGAGAAGGSDWVLPDADPASLKRDACTPLACQDRGYSFCGKMGSGCGSEINCGTCTDGKTCTNNQCVVPGCVPVTCNPEGGQYCGGVLGDTCGGQIDCGAPCAKGWVCTDNLCMGDSTCQKLACFNLGGNYCGKVGDGCGGSLECPSCAKGYVCTKGVCLGDATCNKLTCVNTAGGRYCGGTVGDGCGGSITCNSPCPSGSSCKDRVCVPDLCTGPGCVCKGLQCQIASCDGKATTSISGTVYDPAGKNPVYNVIVYVPNAALAPIVHGAVCDTCNSTPSGVPLATALTDTHGRFKIEKVPSGSSIPLVMQIGKWRRQIKLATVKPCVDNPIAASLTHLPRNKTDDDYGTASLPKMAVVFGDADRLACLLRRMGVDASEFTLPEGLGLLSVYNQDRNDDACGSITPGGTMPFADTNLWNTLPSLMVYDMLVLSCGGGNSDYNPTKSNTVITAAMRQNILDYVNKGGRVFAEHYHWTWLRSFFDDAIEAFPAPFGPVATWIEPISTQVISANPRPSQIDTSFPKGAAFADWLTVVGASTALGSFTIPNTVKPGPMDHINPPAQRWIYEPVSAAAPTGPASYTHYFTFNAPTTAPVASQCGRFVYTTLHVSDSNPSFKLDPNSDSFPGCCVDRDLSPEEKALEFMIFDLSACVQSDKDLPVPPPPPDAPPDAPPASVPPPAPPPPPPPPRPIP